MLTSPSTGSLDDQPQGARTTKQNKACHSHLLQAGQNEDRRLTHTRLGLTEHISAKNGLGNALLLDWMSATRVAGRQKQTFRRVLETEVRNGTKNLGLEQEVAEAS